MDSPVLVLSWQAIGVIIAFVVLWSGIFLYAVKWMLEHGVGRRIDEWAARHVTLERDFLHFQKEVLNEYVRKEDWIRFGTMFRSRQDELAHEVEALKEQNNVFG